MERKFIITWEAGILGGIGLPVGAPGDKQFYKWKEISIKAGHIIGRSAVILCFLFAATSTPGRCSKAVDNGIYAGLLRKYVRNGVVDYAGLKRHEAEVKEYLKLIERTNTKDLSRNEQLAFYINAYNISAIEMVLMGYPGIGSIKDMGSLFRSVWKKKICRIDGKSLSLDDIEDKIIRPGFHDPRIHFALNCASKSCPPLSSEPYRGAVLNRQLDSAARAFINNPRSNFLKGNTLYLSKIFYWYRGDFEKRARAKDGKKTLSAWFGKGPGDAVLAFIMQYAEPALKKKLKERANRIEIEYLPYDWSLNGK